MEIIRREKKLEADWVGVCLIPPLDLPGALKITLEIDHSTLINTWH